MMRGLKDLNIPGKKIIYGAVYGLVALPILMIILQISPIWIIWTAIILGVLYWHISCSIFLQLNKRKNIKRF